jgi:hypothetical protein
MRDGASFPGGVGGFLDVFACGGVGGATYFSQKAGQKKGTAHAHAAMKIFQPGMSMRKSVKVSCQARTC